jgi:DHA3 family macrolide efflux protein-like MFS transporter
MVGLVAFVRAPGARIFLLVLGASLSHWSARRSPSSLGVWVYTQTGSPTQFVVTVLCAALPRILLAPLTGALVDRWDRRLVLIGSDLGAALVTLALALLALVDLLAVWHAYAVAALGSVAASLQRPAAVTSVSLLLDEEHFARASGLADLVPSLASIVASVVAGVLYLRVGLPAVLLLFRRTGCGQRTSASLSARAQVAEWRWSLLWRAR